MSITSSLNNAMSGLNAAARAADVVSSNVANAMTEGYARRELQLSSRDASGVRIDGIQRILDQAVLTDRRLAVATAGKSGVSLAFFRRAEAAIGTPDQGNSLSGKITAFEAALVEAAARPDSDARLANVLTTAQEIAAQFNAVSGVIQTARQDADRTIAAEVSSLNKALEMVSMINRQIATTGMGNRDVSALLDQRQQLIDQIASIVPIKEVARENGQIALFTSGGAVLLDGKPANIGFEPVGLITPDMTLQSGALSGLTVNGLPAGRGLDGGSLSAHLEVRDVAAVTAQAQLDALARDLMTRLADPAVDPTGAIGLFTDRGAAFDLADEAGLAGRLAVNPAADPAQGGALWRLRDGLGASVPGDKGDSRRLIALGEALEKAAPAGSGNFGTTPRSFAALSAEFLSMIAVDRQATETRSSFANARVETLRLAELQGGVDTDQELQRLMLIEQAYAANARVIQAVDDMIQSLLRL